MMQPGLYFHVPFCEKKCAYCNFYSVTTLKDIPDYVKAVLEETSLYAKDYDPFDTIYIGGGSPSLLTPAQISEMLTHAWNTFTITAAAEITVEANPADASAHWLTSLRQVGVNRLNLGVQSFDDDLLRFLGRRHTGRQAAGSMAQARAAGFENIGLDLLYGVPGQSLLIWKDTLAQALAFDPEHLSCYQLTLEGDTPLQHKYRQGTFALPDEDAQLDFFMTTADFLENAGYRHYEISNFARSDRFKSRHNSKYWRHAPYLGLGPAAHSFSGNRRWWNFASVKEYLHELAEGRRPIAGSEQLTPSQQALEVCFLGLRTAEGIRLRQGLPGQENEPLLENSDVLKGLVQDGWMVLQDGFLKPTRRGLAVADRLALMLCGERI
jgi:oxygen-independent coproporphyrinogen-3 oxidase